MDLGLRGLKAVLAGASKGIGRATAEMLAAEGCDVAICSRGQESVDEATASLRQSGGRVFGEAINVADVDAYTAWVKRAAENLGGCDIFISFVSAGGGPPTEATWKLAMDNDLLTVFRGVQALLPFLEKSSAPSIVTISTTAAVEEFYGPTAYSAIKAAVISYSSALAQQLAAKGVRVNTVTPGPVWIAGGSWERVKANAPAMYDTVLARIPMGRMGTGEELARAIAFIASPACRYMTGANVVIDGAFTKRVQY